jgi:hypothetical protein
MGQLTAPAVPAWLGRTGVKSLHVEPCAPGQWLNESIDGKLRGELLKGQTCYTPEDAKVLIESC